MEILRLLEELQEEGVTIVMVTHNPGVAKRADRTIWLRDGQVEKNELNWPNMPRPKLEIPPPETDA